MSKSSIGWRKAGISSLATAALVAGACVAGAGAANATTNFAFQRLNGTDRYGTSALVAKEFGQANDVIVASGLPGHYPDALAANYLAGIKNAPVLLTKADSTPPAILQAIKDSGAKNVWIVGGTGVISQSQGDSLEQDGYNVQRLAGSDRFATATDVINAGGTSSGEGIVATGLNFPDALGAGPLAYAKDMPLAISKTDSISQAEIDALKAAGVTKVLIVGGTKAVSDAVVAELKANNITVDQRLSGSDRAATAAAVANYELNNGFTSSSVNVASGFEQGDGADALGGGALSGKDKTPMLITNSDVHPGAATLAYLTQNANTLTDGYLFGGTAAVSQDAQNQMEAAAQSVTSATALPELTAAKVVSTTTASQATPSNPAGTTVRYTFDKSIATAGGLGPVASNFKVYSSAGAPGTAGSAVVSASGSTVDVRFNTIATTDGAAMLTVATVNDGAVFETNGDTNPEGDAPLGSTSGGGSVTLPAGVTNGPDLVSVGNFRQGANPGDTAVDFTFDEAATTTSTVTSGTPDTEFALHLLNGDVLPTEEPDATSTTPGGGTVPGGNGTTTITVVYHGGAGASLLTAADVARGTVADGAVQESTDNESPANGKDANVLQAAAVSNGGNTTGPDLVSVELKPGTTDDQALYTFDQAVTAPVAADFYVYHVDGSATAGTGTATINPSNSKQVLVTFTGHADADAVGGNVTSGAVTGGERDEEGVANSTSESGQTAGKTDGPDLTSVSLATATDAFGNPTGVTATYTFDEKVATATFGNFHLYLADGTQLTAKSCTVNAKDATMVDCTFTGPSTDPAQAIKATLGTVDTSAVTAVDAGPTNPEGAEFPTVK